MKQLLWTNVIARFEFNTLRPILNRRHFADDIFKCIFENENEWISPRISLKFVPKVRINNIPALVQIMAWHRPGDKPLSEPMMVSLPTHICVTRPQWVKMSFWRYPILHNTPDLKFNVPVTKSHENPVHVLHNLCGSGQFAKSIFTYLLNSKL